MPYTFFGIGTAFIGKRDFGTDGSFVTTEFKTVVLPLYPIRTDRVVEGASSTEHQALGTQNIRFWRKERLTSAKRCTYTGTPLSI